MTRQQKLILPLIGTALLCLLVGIYLFACKRFVKSKRSATIIRHQVDTQTDETLKYWTKDRMRNAEATNMPHVDTLDPEKQHSQRPPSSPHHS
jgi:hypothetical protein